MNLNKPIKNPLRGVLEDVIYPLMTFQARSELIQRFRIELGSGLYINLYERLHKQVAVGADAQLGRFV